MITFDLHKWMNVVCAQGDKHMFTYTIFTNLFTWLFLQNYNRWLLHILNYVHCSTIIIILTYNIGEVAVL
jgi:hypothetical protein